MNLDIDTTKTPTEPGTSLSISIPQLDGVDESRSTYIADQFAPKYAELMEMEANYLSIIKEAESGINTSVVKAAIAQRKAIAKIRTATGKIKQIGKASALAEGRAWDLLDKTLRDAASDAEMQLKAIEDYAKRVEDARLAALQLERAAALSPYVEDAGMMDLSGMLKDVFASYLASKKKSFDDARAEEKRIESERIAAEKAERAKIERLRKENEVKRKEAEKAAKIAAQKLKKEKADREAERIAQAKKDAAVQAKIKADKEVRDKKEADIRAKAEAECKQIEDKAREDRRIAAEKLKAEQDKTARIEAERIANVKRQQTLARKAENAPDREKLIAFAKTIDSLEFPNIAGDDGKQIQESVKILLEKTTKFILDKARNM